MAKPARSGSVQEGLCDRLRAVKTRKTFSRNVMTENASKLSESSYFAVVAESYDRLQPVIAGRSYGNGLDMIVELIPFDPDDAFSFVELGCGTAELSMRVLQYFPHAKGTCVDSEREMLLLATQKMAEHKGRVEIQEADMTNLSLPSCDVVLSAKAFHHVPPADLARLLVRIARALQAGGCFILYDHIDVGPQWGGKVREQSRRLYHRHVQAAIAAGKATQEEIDARWAFKRRMKAEGKDLEYRHAANDILQVMSDAGFTEVGIVWRMFADTILVGFTPHQDQAVAEQARSADS
jgi:ubiquinone/menaquinone biosynthesis C-methylase UbiE